MIHPNEKCQFGNSKKITVIHGDTYRSRLAIMSTRCLTIVGRNIKLFVLLTSNIGIIKWQEFSALHNLHTSLGWACVFNSKKRITQRKFS